MRTLTIILLLAGCKYPTSSTGAEIEGPDAGQHHDGGWHNGSNDGGWLPDAYVYTNDAWPDAGYGGGPDGGYPDGGYYDPDAGSYYPDASIEDARPVDMPEDAGSGSRQVDMPEDAGSHPETGSSAGCATTNGSGAGLVIVGLAALVARRRRAAVPQSRQQRDS